MTGRNRRAFTLLELVATLAAAAILTAAAVVSWQAAFGQARDAAARNAVNAVGAAETLRHVTHGRFSDDPAVLAGAESAYTYTTAASTGPAVVSVATGTGDVDGDGTVEQLVGVAAASDDGTCFGLRLTAGPAGAAPGELRRRWDIGAGAPCTAAGAIDGRGRPW